jgi:phosphoribosylaminoimidazole-succinocarboxamide synthase
MTARTLAESRLPLPLLRRGKVREVYEVDDGHLLLVASDRVSAFDIVMREPIPRKGAVLTQMSAFWFQRLAGVVPSHFITAHSGEILARLPALRDRRAEIEGRAMLVRRTDPVPFECVVRGYLSGSAWVEYRDTGTLAGEPLTAGLIESARLDPPLFSPATKAASGHDLNVTFETMAGGLGRELATGLRHASFEVYRAGRDHAAARGIIIADTKFEFGLTPSGELLLIDEVMTPDSSRFWPADRYQPGRPQPSFDKQPLRDYLAGLRREGRWNGEAPPPELPAEVVEATSRRYLEAFRLITGRELATA